MSYIVYLKSVLIISPFCFAILLMAGKSPIFASSGGSNSKTQIGFIKVEEAPTKCVPPIEPGKDKSIVVPEMGGAGMRGYRVAEVDSTQATAKMGLKKGDLIVAYNGKSIDSPAAAIEAMNSGTPELFTMDVERGGKVIRLQYKCGK